MFLNTFGVSGSVPAFADGPRVGWLDLAESPEGPDLFQSRVVEWIPGIESHCTYQLILKTDQAFDAARRSCSGACGGTLQLPDSWVLNQSSRVYLGVANGTNRPDQDGRQSTLAKLERAESLKTLLPTISESQLPNDLVAGIGEKGVVSIAADWNCDLRLDAGECFQVAIEEGTGGCVRQSGDTTLLVKLKSDSGTNLQSATRLTLSVAEIGTAIRKECVDLSQKVSDGLAFEMVYLTGPHLDEAGLLGQLGPAVLAASQANCEAILITLPSQIEATSTLKAKLGRLAAMSPIPITIENGQWSEKQIALATTNANSTQSEGWRKVFPRDQYRLVSEVRLKEDAGHESAAFGNPAPASDGFTARVRVPKKAKSIEAEFSGAKGHNEGVIRLQTFQSEPKFAISRLIDSDPELVPDVVRNAAKSLIGNGSSVASWWYKVSTDGPSRATDGQATGGRATGGPGLQVFFDPDRAIADAASSDFVIWAFSESGWRSNEPSAIGEYLDAYPKADWILVQRVDFGGGSQLQAPRFVQTTAMPQSADRLDWKRLPERETKADMPVVHFRANVGEFHEDGVDEIWHQVHAADSRSVIGNIRLQFPPSAETVARTWLWYYDHDTLDAEIQRLVEAGITPDEVLASMRLPADRLDDLAARRRYLLALDQPSLRKQSLDLIVEQCDWVVKHCQNRLSALRDEGVLHDGEAAVEAVQIYSAWLADALYRRVRAIGYRELPEVLAKNPIADLELQNQAYEDAYHQLSAVVPINDWRFVLTRVRFERRRGNAAKAYRVLLEHGYQGPAIPWYFKKERDLWSEAGDEALRRIGYSRWFQRQNGLPVTH
ncbi:hypothetical protein CGZ80_10560 [Rhodopirellula sp. MGV]|nr:hypothetical protein CGZ80_10560 [Rhodopirellula sp. MGV]